MTTIKFEKHGDWSSFSGPDYGIKVDGLLCGTIGGGYCWKGGGCRSQGRKTRDYTVIVKGKRVGHVYTLDRAKEIARRAVASVGYTTRLQPSGVVAVFDPQGVKVYETDSYYAVAAKFPLAARV